MFVICVLSSLSAQCSFLLSPPGLNNQYTRERAVGFAFPRDDFGVKFGVEYDRAGRYFQPVQVFRRHRNPLLGRGIRPRGGHRLWWSFAVAHGPEIAFGDRCDLLGTLAGPERTTQEFDFVVHMFDLGIRMSADGSECPVDLPRTAPVVQQERSARGSTHKPYKLDCPSVDGESHRQGREVSESEAGRTQLPASRRRTMASAGRPRSWAYARDDNRLLSWDELVLLPVQ